MNAQEAATNDPTILIDMDGEPLIAYQIEQLRDAGISRFLIEIESLPGAIVAMTERLQQHGLDIRYVRAPQDLEGVIDNDELLLVLCDGIVADDNLLKEIVSNTSRYIVTLDGREENSRYERIDLNSYWAGIALLDTKSVSAIAALPEGWSIRSSLLRQALQDAVPHRPLNQALVLANQLRRITTQQEAAALGKERLRNRARATAGIVESKIFAPLISVLVPYIRKSSIAEKTLQFAIPFLTVSSLATAIAGFAPMSAVLALVSIFGLQIKSLMQRSRSRQFIVIFMWAILSAAFVLSAWKNSAEPITATFAPIVALGLLLLACKLPIQNLSKLVLTSPALLGTVTLLLCTIGQFGTGIQLFVLVQLLILTVPLYFRDKQQ